MGPLLPTFTHEAQVSRFAFTETTRLETRLGHKNLTQTIIVKVSLSYRSCSTSFKTISKAKFIYIHRDPYEVFLSGAYMASTTYGHMFLQRPSDAMLQEYILKQGELLVNEYLRCKEMGLLTTKVSHSFKRIIQYNNTGPNPVVNIYSFVESR
jgi:hypothetical protein